MRGFYRVMLGRKNVHAAECHAGGFIGVGFGIEQDLSDHLPEEWRDFNKEFIPVFLTQHPGRSRISAGLACGALWTVSKGIQQGDVVLSPDGTGKYFVGEVVGNYRYEAGHILPHRRSVNWFNATIDRAAMSDALRNAVRSIGTVSNVSHHREELERLLSTTKLPGPLSDDPTILDLSSFAFEQHLEDFLFENWSNTELGKEFDIYEEDEEKARQYQTDTGPLDILAISKDKKKLLVVELKRGRASDSVVGQTLRYMSYVQDELAEVGQSVHGAIIAHEDDPRLRRAIAMTPNITFYRYQVNFKLVKFEP